MAAGLEWSRSQGLRHEGTRSAAQHRIAQARLVFYLPLSGGVGPFTPLFFLPSSSFPSVSPRFRFLLAMHSDPKGTSPFRRSRSISPRDSPSFTGSSDEPLAERWKKRKRRGREGTSEIKHLFKWQPFQSATSAHTIAHYVRAFNTRSRCVCVDTRGYTPARKSAREG